MTIQSWRAGAVTWIAWVVAGGLGGGLATLVALAGMGSWLNDNADQFAVLGYEMAFAAIASLFQYLVLQFVAAGRRAAVLWLPATVLAINVYMWLNELWMTRANDIAAWLSGTFHSLDPESTTNLIFSVSDATYAVAFGAVQGLVLVVMFGRKVSVALWLAGNLLGLVAELFIPRLIPFAPTAPGQAFIASSAIGMGAYALGTGLALLLILRLQRPNTAVPVVDAVPALQGQG